MIDLSDTSIAYIAGLFDGEGCVGIYQRYKFGRTYQMRMIISNCNFDVLDWISSVLGGSISPIRVNGRRPCYSWVLCSAKASEVLQLLLPYLMIKKEQAEAAIEFQSTQKSGGRSNKYSTSETVQRDALAKLITELKTS